MGLLEELGLRVTDPLRTKDPDLAALRQVRAEAIAEVDAIGKQYGIGQKDLARAREAITVSTSPPAPNTLHPKQVVNALRKQAALDSARRVETVPPGGAIACRVVKVDPAPMRLSSSVLFGGESYGWVLVDENEIAREPSSVAVGLRSGRVAALVGWKSLGKSDLENDIKAAAAVALERESLRALFAAGK